MMRRSNAFTLTETLVAAVVFLLCAGGLLASITSIRKNAVLSDNKVKAAMFQRKVIEDLRSTIDANSWDDPDLVEGAHNTPLTDANFLGINATYTITTMGDGSKKIDVLVNYPNGS